MSLWIDNTILSAVQTCDLKAGLRYGLGLTTGEPRLELDAGSAIHASLASWHRGEGVSQAMQVLKDAYETAGKRVAVEDRLSYHNVRRVMQRFYTYFQQNPLPYTVRPDLVEVTFEAPLDEHGDILIVGRLDQVETYQGRLVVGENKTGGSLNDWWEEEWPMSSQLTTYVYGARYGQVGGKPLGLPVEECYLTGIELRKVPDSSAKCRDHKVAYAECGDFHIKWKFSGPHPRPEPILRRWRDDALKAATTFQWMQANITTVKQAVEVLPQQGQFVYKACARCEFRDYCRQGCPADLMEANLVNAPWDHREIPTASPAPLPTPPPGTPTPVTGVPPLLVGTAPIPSNARQEMPNHD